MTNISMQLSNFAVGLWTPPLLERIGWATYLFYAAWNLIALFVVWKWFVETKGKSLEEIEAIFNDGAVGTEVEKALEHQTEEEQHDRDIHHEKKYQQDSPSNSFVSHNEDVENNNTSKH